MSDMVQIPGRDIVALLRAEAKRKPAIAQLMNDVVGMTDEQIAALKVPLPWYRVALKKCRDLKISAETTQRVSEIVSNAVVEVFINDIDGTMRQFTGDTQFIKVARGGDVEIKYGTFIWFPHAGGVWIDTLFSSTIDPKLAESTFIGDINKQGYINARAEQRSKNAPVNVPGTVVDGAPSSNVNPLFTIQRH